MTDQNVITDQIRAKYADDPRIPHPVEVALAERAGTVTLRGSVGSPHQRVAAVEIAKSVPGVREVVDELSVDLRDRWGDDELRGAALQALMSEVDTGDGWVDVAVDAGWVTLTGQVKHQEQSNAAFETVAALGGVGGITNKIVVVTAGGH